MFPPVVGSMVRERMHRFYEESWTRMNRERTGANWNEKEATSTCVERRGLGALARVRHLVVVDLHSLSSRLAWNDYAFPTDYPLRRENFSGFTSSCYIKIPEQTRGRARIAASRGARHCPRVSPPYRGGVSPGEDLFERGRGSVFPPSRPGISLLILCSYRATS